jgi:hypothetical protein
MEGFNSGGKGLIEFRHVTYAVRAGVHSVHHVCVEISLSCTHLS